MYMGMRYEGTALDYTVCDVYFLGVVFLRTGTGLILAEAVLHSIHHVFYFLNLLFQII